MGHVTASKYMVNAGWDDVPHLTAKTKQELLASTPPHLRDARSKGTPALGSGAIYPVALEEVLAAPFAIPPYWKRGYALDVGWNRTAAIWGAQDPADGVIYAYAEHYMGQAIPTIHAASINARGEWIKGAIDPASRGRSQSDGEQLMTTYKGLNLKLTPAINAVEPGLYEVWTLLSTGRLRIFSTLMHTQAEYRLYRRDEHGKVVKKNDHLMDALRYLIMTWHLIGSVKPADMHVHETTLISDTRAGY